MRGLRIAAALIAAFAALPANAQTYPDPPAKIVLPFAAGGVADVTSRLAADKLGEKARPALRDREHAGPRRHRRGSARCSAAPDG